MRPGLRRFLQVCAVTLALTGLGGAWAYQSAVVQNPGPEFEREAILSIIAQESPVYYRDGVTPMGVFFDREHRSYVPYAELPRDWIDAIVASEDGSFFSHPGVDPKHILRATWQNLRAGGVVAGGSTLTQQTAKNLFYRPDRSLRSKAVELVDALRLEAHYSKEDILEFYANQFHVSANGRGIGVAARYFFDKTPSQLSTKECAFIAGLVKAPSRYNPFIGQTAERRAEAQAAGEKRTSYVLRRMVATGALPEALAAEIEAEPLVFKRGSFRYDRSIVLDEVQKRLEEPSFIELFEKAGIDNPSTAGLKIVTTVDKPMETAAVYGLWHHLTELAPALEKPALTSLLLPEDTATEATPNQALAPYSFHAGRVVSAAAEGVVLDLGGRTCPVPVEGVQRIAKAFAVKPAALAEALPPGRFVLASVQENGSSCDVEWRPRLQGATVILEEGRVRAMVGGNDNRSFNRVSTARRQFGSTWKPLVYLAAVQLGWLPTDILDNRRNTFPFRGVWYYPSADHASDPFVSMSATGARSENLSSVWLLYHLTDRLGDAELRRLGAELDLLPRAVETPADFAVRMRDTLAIRSSTERFEEYAFTQARADVLAALGAGPHAADAVALRSLVYGNGAAAERARVERTAASAEREARLIALDNTFHHLEEAGRRCAKAPLASLSWDPLTQELACGRVPAGFVPLPPEALAVAVSDRVDGLSREAQDAVLVDARVHLGTLRALRTRLDEVAAGLEGKAPYDPDVLVLHPDWRVLAGVRTLTRLARDLGVRVEMPENLTLPLGAADVSLVELAGAYEGMLSGDRMRFGGEGFVEGSVIGVRTAFPLPESDESTALIQEIRDAGGNVLYRLAPRAERVVDPRSGAMVGDILRNVVLHGTGRRAASEMLGGTPLALAGKTGTTNDYRNAAFLGFVPLSKPGVPPTWGKALTVATYVGYDDNTPMRKGALRVQGSNGALPAWLGAVRILSKQGALGSVGGEYVVPPGLSRVDTLPGTGLPGIGMSVMRPTGEPPERIMALPGTDPLTTRAPAEAPPSGSVGLPTDADFGPPEPEEGVDPRVPAAAPEPAPGDVDLGDGFLLPG